MRKKLINHHILCVGIFAFHTVTMIGCESSSDDKKVSSFGSLREKNPKKDPKIEENSVFNLTKTDDNTWRMSIHPLSAFQLISRILAQNYIIARADKKSLVVTTEWDKFFINGKLFRNKLSANVFPISANSTEIVIKNTLEYYASTDNESSGANDNYWVPSQDITTEVAKVIGQLTKQAQIIARSNATD